MKNYLRRILRVATIPGVFLVFTLTSCGGDDDICTGGEGTPRMKMAFRTADGKIKTLDTLYVDVDYGNGPVSVISQQPAASEVLIPLRVDDAASTEVYVRTRKKIAPSRISVQYKTENEYVSPACGIRRLYRDLNFVLQTPLSEVKSIIQNQNEITNEHKTSLYLVF